MVLSDIPKVADPPRDARIRVEWIKYLLAARGVTVSRVAEETGIDKSAVSHGLRDGSVHVEATIARLLEVHPMKLWPERYDAEGNRLRKKPGPKPGARRRRKR